MLIDGKRTIASEDPCCKMCGRGECEYNVNRMCLNKGVCGKFAPPRKEAEDKDSSLTRALQTGQNGS